MTLDTLTLDERAVVRRLLAATFEFFDDVDFHLRLGIESAKMHALLADWKNIDDSSDKSDACLAINNSLNDLLHGVGISESQALALAGVSKPEIDRIYRKWAIARGRKSRGVM